MILYSVVCYLIMLGMIVEDHDQNDNSDISWWSLLLAPILVPVFIGIKMQEKK